MKLVKRNNNNRFISDSDTILAILHTRTGIDFSQYKSTTVNRRIQRRMLLNHIKTLPEYRTFLEKNPDEVNALRRDMLIHVTSFFREFDQFEVLKKSVFPTLAQNRSSKTPITVWVPGCATGEEAYSLAIAFQEFLGKKALLRRIKIFATDIDEDAIREARKGLYKKDLINHVSPQRLRRFFTKKNGGYQIKQAIRTLCEFEVHDVAHNPPLTNADLISCHNLLIYLGQGLQKKALIRMHQALASHGFLVLGKAEGLGEASKLFHTIDSKQRIYSRKDIDVSLASEDLQDTVNVPAGKDYPSAPKPASTMQPEVLQQFPRQQRISKLREALSLTQEYANEIIDELDVMNKELQSAIEELQASNEETKALNEELEIRNDEIMTARDYAEAIIKTVRVPLIVLDSNLRIKIANKSFYETFKVRPKETKNKLLYDLGNRQWDIPKLRTLLLEILPYKNMLEDFVVEHDFETIGKKTMILNARILQQRLEKKPLILLSIEDITERKKAEEEQRRLERQKDEFIGIASHELKTPVTSIKAYAQILQHRFQKAGDMKSAGMVGKMDAQIDKLTSLIGDLLDITKIEGGKLQFHEELFDFNELIGEIAEEMQRTTTQHTLVQQLAKAKTIAGDRGRIGQVITNFLSNAIKYSPHADTIIIKTKTDKERVTLYVQDFGCGISKEDQEKVFERFYRVVTSGPESHAGIGLGLYIASEIIKHHNGKIWVESEKGKGSTFCFSLPLKQRKL
ncbi:MAG: ATP-binding protein [Candidatus Jettenia sp.]|nr:MAG: ATP-binding protein [Candidatus Jettenia sp.]